MKFPITFFLETGERSLVFGMLTAVEQDIVVFYDSLQEADVLKVNNDLMHVVQKHMLLLVIRFPLTSCSQAVCGVKSTDFLIASILLCHVRLIVVLLSTIKLKIPKCNDGCVD